MGDDRTTSIRGTEDLEAATLRMPRWIESGAVMKLLGILLILFAAPAMLPWRATLAIPVTVGSQSPPRSIIVPAEGVIATILVRPDTAVVSGAPLAKLGDARTIAQVEMLESYANQVVAPDARFALLQSPPPVAVGNDLQQAYDALVTAVTELQAQADFGSDGERIDQLERSVASLAARERQTVEAHELAESLVTLSAERLEVKTDIAARGWGTVDAVAAARETLIERRLAVQRSAEEIAQLRAQIDVARSDLAQARLDQQRGSSRLDTRVRQTAINLLGAIKAWRDRTTITSPIAGRVKFPTSRNIGQSLAAGSEFAVVLPGDTAITATGMVPPNSRADVAVGAEVRIALPNYPPVHYGYVIGSVVEVADVASEGGYSLRIQLPQGLRTSNGMLLPVRQRANATALVSVRQGRIFDAIMGRLLN